MSDRKWSQDVWDVLMDDGTELLNVVVNQSDRNAWPAVAKRHNWDGDQFRAHGVQFWIWSACKRRGDIGAMTFEYFLEHIADWEKQDPQDADPTRPAI
jgi:hypothetical protein